MTLEGMTETLKSARQALAEKRPDDAIGLLQQVCSVSPQSAEALSLLGAAHAEKKDYAQALQYFEQSLAIQPTARGWFNVAALHKMRNDIPLTRTALEKALALDPQYERARQMLSQLTPPSPQIIPEPTVLNHAQMSAGSSGPPSYGATPAPSPTPGPAGVGQMSDPIGPQYPQMGDPFAQPQQAPAQSQPKWEEQIIWWKVVVGGLMVGLPSLLVWAGWMNTLSIGMPVLVAAVVSLGITVAINRWLAANVGDFDLWHYIILFFLTGLIPALLIIKGYELIFSGYYASKKV